MSPEVLPQLFNSYVELHTAQLGVLLGLFVGLLYRERPVLAYLLLFFGVLSALGNASHIGFMRYSDVATEIEAKPWYFLSALYATTVLNLLAVEHGPRVLRFASRATRRLPPGPDGEEIATSDDRL
ncbi:hypothetical protein [Halosimplex amylolyticum]|uniref:hypothetical protein n=1 Tax=Halosimplex amylolyticum TaxID=3396616 RepID=UPI003F573782